MDYIKGIVSLLKDDKHNKKKILLNFFEKDFKNFRKKLLVFYKKISSKIISSKRQPQIKFNKIINSFLKKLQDLEKNINDKKVIRKTKKIFGTFVLDLSKGSVIFKRSYLKPYGYPGDYIMMETFYNNKALSSGIATYWDNYILNDHFVVGVRNRKEIMKQKLANLLLNNNYSKEVKILNIACGSCRELFELFNEIVPKQKVIITLVDQDEKALKYSRKRLARYNKLINLRFLQQNVYNFCRRDLALRKLLRNQDFIYNIGLADYLPDSVLGGMIKFSFEILKENGLLIFAHKNTHKFSFSASDWFSNWRFIPRTRKDLVDLIGKNLEPKRFLLKIEEDCTKRIFFSTIRKIK